MSVPSHQLRCTGCGDRIAAADAQSNFRCRVCGDLFEVEYPWSPGAEGSSPEPHTAARPVRNRPNPSALRYLWQERRTSTLSVDQSGVWRFRDLLPIVADDQIVTLLGWLEAHAARGWLIADLHRHFLAYYGFPVLARLAGWHRIVRQDGRISIARSFRRAEWQALLDRAGIAARIKWRFPFRYCIERLK